MGTLKKITFGTIAISILAQPCLADVKAFSNVKISGFGSIVGNVTDHEGAGYLRHAKVTDTPDFVRETRVGVQFNIPFSKKIEFITQFTGDHQDDTYSVNAEWIIGKWKINDMFTLRGGRMVIPVFAQSDTINVHFAHPMIRNPSEQYEMLPISNFNGIDLLVNIPIGDSFLVAQPYYGSTELQSPFGFSGVVTTTLKGMYGLKLRLETENHNFYVSVMDADDVSMVDPGIVTGLVGLAVLPSQVLISNVLTDIPLTFTALGWNGVFGNFEGYSEYAERDLGATAAASIEAAYITGVYNMGSYSPYLSLATTETTDGRPQTQESITLGLRQRVADGASLKYEFHHAVIDDGIPGNRGLYSLSNPSTADFPDSVNMLSVALDVTF